MTMNSGANFTNADNYEKKYHDELPFLIRIGSNLVKSSFVGLWIETECACDHFSTLLVLLYFHPIWMKTCTIANFALKTTMNQFEIATVIFWPASLTNENQPVAKIFRFCIFHPTTMIFNKVLIPFPLRTIILFRFLNASFRCRSCIIGRMPKLSRFMFMFPLLLID